SQHKRAVNGMECIRAIGSETALLQLSKLANKVKFPALKKQANEAMEAIANERGLTPDQLQDRIVPNLDLDDKGQRTFDYGTRQFTLMLGTDLKPKVREDGTTTVKADLPKPTKKDDPVKGAAAQAEMKLFKQQLRETLKTQAERLETCMRECRFWDRDEFESL